MIVVIPVAMEPTNATLPLAIESIRRHTDYEIVTIGHDHGIARHIELEQSPRRHERWANTDRAMRKACETFDSFVWSADDIYWTRPAVPIRWSLGQLGTTARYGEHGRRKSETQKWLQARGLPTWDYESHTPMPIESDQMIETLEIIDCTRLDKRTIYGNLTGEPDLVAPDVKIRDENAPMDTPWLSSNAKHHWRAIEQAVRG